MKLLPVGLVLLGVLQGAAAQQGGEFLNQKVSKLATSDADFLCERLYDSASPVSMVVELATIVGPRVLLGAAPDLTGVSPEENKKMFDQLRTLARRKVWLPIAAEAQIGGWMNDKFERDGAVVPESKLNARDRARLTEIRATLDSIVGALPADNAYKFKLQVVQGDQSNASIAPGGFVYLNLGLVRDRTLTKDDIALRLSHEVSHLTRRHALKDIQLKLIDAMAVSKDIKGMLSIASDPLKTMQSVLGTATATMLLFQRFDQNQELESDACGMYLLSRTPGVDAHKALKNYVARKPLATPESWDTSHPAADERQFVMELQLNPQELAKAKEANKTRSGTSGGGTGSSVGGGGPTAAGKATAAGNSAAPTEQSGATGGLKGMFDSIKRALPAGGAASGAAGPEAGNPGGR